MPTARCALFSTSLGTCATVWSSTGITGLALPERSARELRARLTAQFGDPQEAGPERWVQEVIDDVEMLLRGECTDLTAVPLDMSAVPPFHQRVYQAARQVPFGRTVTYGQLAMRLDSPGAARAVGQALGRNPFAIIVPCHRVLAANGKLGGFTAHGGTTTKQRLLAIERGSEVLSGNLSLSGDW